MDALTAGVGGYLFTQLFKNASSGTGKIKIIQKIKSNWAGWIDSKSAQFNIPEKYVYAIIATESAGNPNARGSAGEIGLMQISNLAAMNVNQIYGTDFDKDNLKNPYNNILCGVMYLSIIHTYFPNFNDVIMAYNIGMGNVQKNKHLDAGKRYLKRVMEFVHAYENS